MSNPVTLEPAIDPNNRITFLLDWELTLKCNLDCDYCPTGTYGGHDNSTSHPPLTDCLRTIDFAFEYADAYMSTKPRGLRYVVLNVYGGESLHHPNIVEILQAVKEKHQSYQDRWHLTVTTTTNAVVTKTKLTSVLPLIDEFTVSYHTNNTEKQKQQFKENLLSLKNANKRLKCIVLMHNQPELFEDAQAMIKWLTDNDIKHLPRQLDSWPGQYGTYGSAQVKWFENLYQQKSQKQSVDIDSNHTVDLADTGRACCGGRQLCEDKNYQQRSFFVVNKFPNWYCSVNHFFVYIKQINGEIYTNKDCKMNFDGSVSPIGNLSNTDELLTWTKNSLANKTMPTIQCQKFKCICGLCAPKAKSFEDYQNIMKKYSTQ